MNLDPTRLMIKRAALLAVAQAQRDGATDLIYPLQDRRHLAQLVFGSRA
jgi:hypothetical protein